ncbi:hypothetical protein Tsubulata_043012 [Turnera subulata]|uniref:BED-type domain-containing protein n=1 Tax=Turnera subulata TaxID=218843 RepID=A0A9Q0JCY3_9ROSI|nr:hypothetical protein Tsubulata_043012 [Turnera subulata]
MPPKSISTADHSGIGSNTPSSDAGVAVASTTTTAKGKRKPMQPRSEVWAHFSKFVTENGEEKARCLHCEREFAANTSKNGTTVLKRHMDKFYCIFRICFQHWWKSS